MKDAARRRVMGMRTVSGAMAVFALSMVAQTCFATGAANDRQIRTLMVQSGLKKQIEQIPLFLQRELSQQRHKFKDLTQEEMDRIDGIAMQAFDATSMNENVRRYIESNLSQNDVTAALDWLESPLGTKITRLEEQSSTPEGHAEMERMAPGLVEEYRGTARIAKIRELDDKTGATEASVNTVLNLQLAMITAVTAAMNVDNPPTYEEVQELVGRNRTQLQAVMEPMVQLQFLYAYRTLTDGEIDRYIRFAGSESGRKYHSVTAKGINYAFIQAARKFGTRLGMKMNRI